MKIIKVRHTDIDHLENDYELPQLAKTLLDERLRSENKADFIPVEEAQAMLRQKYGL
ncbi:hypothetical protein [Flavobacterium subsaxonicum]|uniref:hypothetical protein n=1 Tax=Flavobacterium subsaxonicum TaxID=426226 RepID=UPI000401D41C|nr:hypothetical protein [Flavobacterium subsaxonicum]